MSICLPIAYQLFLLLLIVFRIDHWDVAREKVVFTSKKNLYSIRFDFVSNTVYEIKTIPLAAIDEACYGDIAYPRFSMIK